MPRYLLDNKHRVTVVMLPDSELAAKTEEAEKQRLEAARAAMSEQDVSLLLGCTAKRRMLHWGYRRSCGLVSERCAAHGT